MEVSLAIRQRLEQMGLEQKDLARAAGVTESYVSQLLSRKKPPPSPSRTDIYARMDRFLELPEGELAKLADLQRMEELKRELGGEPAALLPGLRTLILAKCRREKESHVRAIFERAPFGEFERLVTQKLLDVVKRVASDELENRYWLRTVAQLSGRSDEAMRATALACLDADIFDLSSDNYTSFFDAVIASWDVDLKTFGLEVILNRQITAQPVRKFGFVEEEPGLTLEEPGLREFLNNPALAIAVTEEEEGFLRRLRFRDRRPTAIYYYRELQNLRDPFHFHSP